MVQQKEYRLTKAKMERQAVKKMDKRENSMYLVAGDDSHRTV